MSKTNFKRIAAATLAVLMCLSVVGCGTTKDPVDNTKTGTYTYRTYTTTSPSNWNELTYKDANDTQIMSYIGSSFFSYDFKFDANGEIVPGEFVMKYEAATKLEDVSAVYAEAWNLPVDDEGNAKKGYAYKITLREDLKWENGDPIKAADFVYSMQQQLDPKFQNYRADSFYAGSTIIVNAQNYVKQGQTLENLDNGVAGIYTMADLVKGDNGVYTQPDGSAIYFSLNNPLDWTSGYSPAQLAGVYLDATAAKSLAKLANEDGNVPVTDESIALWKTLICTEAWGYEDESYLPNYLIIPSYTYPVTVFSDVGIFAASEYELVIVLAKTLPLLKDDGSLSYQAAYNMSSLPLVHKETYEANKVEPAEGSTLWTTTYNTSKDTTMSWGPYKLTDFQGGKQYVLDRNENWYGYGLEENKGLYQTDKIVCDTVNEWTSAWAMFQAGQIDGIGIHVSIADQYKNSDRAYFTPDDYVGSLQLQSSKEALKLREEEGKNKTILSYDDFRKALSLSINRATYAAECTTSSLAGFGLFNSMHYYDVENGKAYRNSDDAKKVICEVYGVDYTKYESLDAAMDAVTGYNMEEAKKLVEKAYQDALKAGDIKAGDVVSLEFGSSEITETLMLHINFLKAAWEELFKGTSLEGKLEITTGAYSDAWADDFRAGKYDICLGGWQGAAWDPGYLLMAYLTDNYRYALGWDPSKVQMEFAMEGETYNYDLITWWNCLNGTADAPHDWSATALEQEKRLPLIAALEKQILLTYYSVPVYYTFSASLISFKVDYITYEYNTFMGYGGMKYMKYNFNDAEWAAEVAAQNGELDYK